jgi:hypothetical protein
MRSPGRLAAALAAVSFAAAPARADDTRPPVICEVKAAIKGGNFTIEAKITDDTGVLTATCFHRKAGAGKFDESSMVKNEYDDNFKVSFPGGADTEYFIQATDLLGNGPASFGAAGKPMALVGAKPPKAEKPPAEPVSGSASASSSSPGKSRGSSDGASGTGASTSSERHGRHHGRATASTASKPPVIEHKKPAAAFADGQDAVLRVRITSPSPIKTAGAFVRTAGNPKPQEIDLNKTSGDTWELTLPAAMAHGTLEYILAAKNDAGQTTQGDGDSSTWFKLAFKVPEAAQQPYAIAHNAPPRAVPQKPIVLRAQVSPTDIEQLPLDKADTVSAQMFGVSARVLFRGQDAADQVVDMTTDTSGGLGGFKAELPAQPDGAVLYYQVVACDNSGDKCAVDTGSRKRWHALRIASSAGAAPPSISAVSSKAPASLPE